MTELLNALIMTFIFASGAAMVLGTICAGCTAIEVVYHLGRMLHIAIVSEFEE